MNDEMFVLIEASKLCMDDEFMQYQPKTDREKMFKALLEEVIKKGIADFWRPRMDPTLDEVENICFKVGKKPAVGKSYDWWRENAKRFNPKRNSRLGTESQYIAFLGVLIKVLVAEGWTVDEAWNSVCNNSQQLGNYWGSVCNDSQQLRNYWDSQNAKHAFEPTGSRAIAVFYDLANTYKILEDAETGGFWLAGGCYGSISDGYPLASLGRYYHCISSLRYGVGWIVMD